MRKVWIWMFLHLFRFTFWLRYRVKVEGLEGLDCKKGGLLVLPNHPTVFIDPTMVVLAFWKKTHLRPVVIDYMYYQPIVYTFMKFVRALAIPNFSRASNSLKRKRGEKVLEEVCEGLRHGESFMIYPAGRLKSSGYEQIGGASAVHRIVQDVPEAQLVLVRTTGLWGSSFSRAATGKTPSITGMVWRGIKKACKNFLFFTPRREVRITVSLAPSDFPREGTRRDMNAYLEGWYNAPFQKPLGEPIQLVSYSMWGKDMLLIEEREVIEEEEVDISLIPEEIKKKVLEKLSLLADLPVSEIRPENSLNADLGLDSIDGAELTAFLQDEFDLQGVPVHELPTVARVMAIAAKKIEVEEEEEVIVPGLERWRQPIEKERISNGKGATIIERFLNKSYEENSRIIVGDLRAGILTYKQLRMRIVLLAEQIRHCPGKYIGVMLPASVAAYILVLAIHLAGKIPLMVNWTVGPRHLDQVKELSGVEVVFTAWSFVDRLENVDFSSMEDSLTMLEELGRKLSLWDKIKAFYWSMRGQKAILRHFGLSKGNPDAEAVLLFTSGTESAPKGVPLTHRNILANNSSALMELPIYTVDVLLGILPPFHAFGFTITGILPLIWGIRAAYSPDPTNGKEVAKAVSRWQATILCGAPTFLKNMLQGASREQIASLRMVVTGAEKAPKELFDKMEEMEKGGRLLEGYGITECSPVITMNRLGDPLPGVGRLLPGIEGCIIDIDTHRPLPIGEQGLILVRGENIFSGYLNKGLKSPFLEIGGKQWYNTGDLGFFDEKTRSLVLSGRLKRFVKIGGEMVSLSAIETALNDELNSTKSHSHKEGPALAVLAKEKEGEKPLFSLVVNFPLSKEAANQALRNQGVSNLVKISQVHCIEEIPIMGTGKIHYRRLEEEFLV